MPHETALIATMSVALALAFVGGFLATRLHLPAIVGYLLAGVVVGPFTPGFVADLGLAPQLAEIGVILLMFGVGLHFSLDDLLAVRGIAIPGAIVQIAVATAICAIAPGMAIARTESRSASEKCRPTPNIRRITPTSASCAARWASPMKPGVCGPMTMPASR